MLCSYSASWGEFKIFYIEGLGKLSKLLKLLYSRLLLFKTMSISMTSNGSSSLSSRSSKARSGQPTDIRDRDRSATAEHIYDLMLESCERLFENDIEQPSFEEQMRCMYGFKVGRVYTVSAYPYWHSSQEAYKIFTIDKLIGAIIKQVLYFQRYYNTIFHKWIIGTSSLVGP